MEVETKSSNLKTWLFMIMGMALGLNILIELLGRLSVLELISHVFYQPIFFLNNVMLLAFTLSFSLFFRRKILICMVIGSFWLAVGMANFVVLSYRITPFSAIDIFIMNWDFSFMRLYANLPQALFCGVVLIGAIVGMTLLYRHCTMTPRAIKGGAVVTLCILMVICGLNGAFFALGVFEPRISDMQWAYEQFGVVSCFTRSVIERGIDQPEDYSEETMDELLEELVTEPLELPLESTSKPNVVMVQLESFFDVHLLRDTTFSENPIPTYTQLTQSCSGGALYVPVVGAGTANTEFEVLTGMSVDYFGTGEYPYETILRERTCESIAYHLKDLGYYTTAMHNHTGTFYQRNEVYPNLGFDTFISSEFMAHTETTPQGWVKDQCLTQEIIQVLTTTEESDFVFAVSVQGHGPFPDAFDATLDIRVTDSPFSDELEYQLEYYINQIYEMDCFVAELLAACEAIEEPTIVVFYGDHLPSLSFEATDLTTGDNYQTSYLIWANYPVEGSQADLHTYQLYAQVFQMMGLEDGAITRLHQVAAGDADYLAQLELLQYDMLYGEEFYADGIAPQPTEMTMGLLDITIEQGWIDGEILYVQGAQFTGSSQIFLEEEGLETWLMADGMLYVVGETIQPGDSITVRQVSSNGTQLAMSQPLIWDD